MTIKELLEAIQEDKPNDIEFEDNEGNTLFWLKDLSFADTEKNEKGYHLRLQKNK